MTLEKSLSPFFAKRSACLRAMAFEPTPADQLPWKAHFLGNGRISSRRAVTKTQASHGLSDDNRRIPPSQKQQLLERLPEDPGPHERDEIERLLAQIDSALNL